MQLTEVQLGRAGAEAEAEASSSPNNPQSPARSPQSGSALREGVSCGIQPTSAQRATRCLAPGGFWGGETPIGTKKRVGYHHTQNLTQRLPGYLSPESWI